MKACKRLTVWVLVLALLLQLVPAFTIALAADTQELIETTYGSFNGEGLWLTEIYTNDVDRSTTNNTREDKGYVSIDLFDSGTSDLMEFVEICSTHDGDIKLNDMYELYNGSNQLVITDASGSSDITLTKGQPVVLWNYRTDLGITLPTEAQFRKALLVPDNALVLRVNYGSGWGNTCTFKINLKSTGATVSSFTCTADTHTKDGLSVELQVPFFKSSAMEVYRALNLPSAGVVYAAQVRGMITANIASDFDGKGLYITEVRPNDVERSSTYGTASDVMECFEVTNTTDQEINLNTDYRIVYTLREGTRKVLELHKYSSSASDHLGSSSNCTVPAGGTAVLWCFRESYITDETSFPTLSKFRTAYGLTSDTPVYIFANQNGLSNDNRSLEIFKPDSNGGLGECVSRYTWLGDADCKNNTSAHLQINPEGPAMLLYAGNATTAVGTVDAAQLQYLLDDGSYMKVRPYDGCTVPTSIMQGEDLRVWFYYKATGLSRTGYSTYYRIDGEGDWIKSAEGGSRVPHRYEAIVSGAELFDHDYVEFYVVMSNYYRDTVRGIYRVDINKLNDVDGIRTNISEGEEVKGTVSITANDGTTANSSTKIYIDGVKQTTTPMLEDGGYLSFTLGDIDSYFKSAITTNKNKHVAHIGKWAYESLVNQVKHIDSSYFTYDSSADTYTLVLRFWAGTVGVSAKETLNPDANREDFSVTNLQLKLANGKSYLPSKIGPSTYDGVDVTEKLNTSTALSAVHLVGDASGRSPYMKVTFTIPASEVTAKGVELDTTTLSEGAHTLKVTNGTSTKEVSFIVDNTAPTVNLGVADGASLTGNITLNPQVTETNNINEFVTTLDGEVIDLPYNTTAYTLGEGSHTLSVYAKDAAGNETTKTATFTVDHIAMNLTGAGSTDITHSSAKLYLTAQSDAATQVTFYKAERIETSNITTNTSGGILPYIQYTIDVPSAGVGDDIVVSWNGSASGIDDTHANNMFVRNTVTGAWELIGTADANGNISNVSFPVENHVADSKAEVIVQCTADSALPDLDTTNDGITGNNTSWTGSATPDQYDFCFAWITDTQYYAQKYQHHNLNMNNWIVNNRDTWRIKYVIHTGDIVDDWNAPYQWENADAAMKIFDDAGMPYGYLGGNHDVAAGLDDRQYYYTYFNEDRVKDQPTYGGSFENNYGHYDLVSENGQDFIIVYMTWNIYEDEINWMNEVLAKHSDRKAILCFHGYTKPSESVDGLLDYFGVMIRDYVVAKNPNVFAVLNGHYHGSAYQTVRFDDDGDGTLDRTVYQIVTDYQSAEEGGLEYIKFMYFDLDNDKVYMNSYSPYLDDFNYYDTSAPDKVTSLAKASSTGVVSNSDIDAIQFKLTFDVSAQTILGNSFSADLYTDEVLGTTTLNAATEKAEYEVSGLNELTDYSWYAVLENDNTGYLRTGVYDLTTTETPCFHESHDQSGVCSACGETVGHSYESVVTAPTCTVAGYTTHTCSVCASSYTDSEVAATGHAYTSKTTAPTCSVDGKTDYTCSNCGDSYSETVGAFGHSYGTTVTPPTCTVGGYTTYTCGFCGNSYVSNQVAATGHSYTDGVCGTCGAADPDYVEPVVVPTMSLTGATLNFEAEIMYNIYFTATDISDVVEMGLITFDTKLTDGTIDNAVAVIPGYYQSGSEYVVHTNGIPAKNLGDAVYFKAYAKLSDGSYAYSNVSGYHAVLYAQEILANSTSQKMKDLVVAMLNYGAAAQTHFGYKTDSLMNSVLTDAQKASIDSYSADMVEGLTAVDSAKLGDFTKTGGFTGLSPNVAFEGAFAINFYLTTANKMDGDLTFYYWRLDDYTAADVLTADNASGVVTATATSNGEYLAVVEGIAAKEIDQTVYISAVYESNGTRYCTGVIAYSLATYCQEMISAGTATMQDFAAETVVYGYYAKQYFA